MAAPSIAGVVQTTSMVNSMLLRPFRARVDLLTVILALALLLAIAGQWHLVLERVEI